ncbi:MAG: hypothetical protein V1760_00750 [Candidatus Peregrinibacteria bacterium]
MARELKSPARGIKAHWNERGVLERLKLILEFKDLFLALRLVTPGEVQMAESMSPSEWAYILDREPRPIFTSVDLKEEVENQHYYKKLLTALRAVFL